ncbi:MAG: response regulator [Pirellulales bacterium]|nr:response regulator [Pirellulales bacterium]
MKDRVLIVDDCPINVRILQELLSEEYELESATSGEECLEKVRDFSPELILLDIMMPGISGYEVCRQIKSSPLGDFTMVILVSGKASPAERLKGYDVGADDYVVKPFDHDELLAKVRIHFRLRGAMKQLWLANNQIQEFNCELEQLVEQRSHEILATRDIAIFALAKLADSRDPETGEHLERMRHYCRILAEYLSKEGPYHDVVDDTFVDNIYRSSPLHDIGKVGIPDAILLKPGKLTTEEFEIMKRHTTIGADALRQAAEQSSSGGFLAMAELIARSHHERFNGSGYPDGLAGSNIPLAARVVALADVYDALTSPRVYKSAFDPDDAKRMIEEERGKHFDPAIIDAFLACEEAFRDVVRAGIHSTADEFELASQIENSR